MSLRQIAHGTHFVVLVLLTVMAGIFDVVAVAVITADCWTWCHTAGWL